jgi:hypothetical protein
VKTNNNKKHWSWTATEYLDTGNLLIKCLKTYDAFDDAFKDACYWDTSPYKTPLSLIQVNHSNKIVKTVSLKDAIRIKKLKQL